MTYQYELDLKHFHLTIKVIEGSKRIGFVEVMFFDEYAVPHGTFVDESYRRKGIASTMYQLAESVLNMKLHPDCDQSDLAKALWANKNKKFGLNKA